PSRQALQASFPHLAISFLSYCDVRGLLLNGFPFDLFCQISDEKRALFASNSLQIGGLRNCRGFNYEVLAQLSTQEIAQVVDPGNAWKLGILCVAGLNFAAFCKLPLRTKQLLLDDQVKQALEKLLLQKVTLGQFLALPPAQRALLTEKPDFAVKLLKLGFTWDELIAMPWDIGQVISEHAFDCSILLKKGVTLQKLAQLELPLLKMVLSHQSHISTYLDAGMDFDTFCILNEAVREKVMHLMPFQVSLGIFLSAGIGLDFETYNKLPEAVRQRVNRQAMPITLLIRRGERLETLLRLTEEELIDIAHNLKGFSCTGTILINAKNMPTVESKAKSVANDAMGTVFNMRAQFEELIKVQMQNHTMTFIYEGIPLARFVELQGDLRQKVLKHADSIGEKIRAGMDVEVFLKSLQDDLGNIPGCGSVAVRHSSPRKNS
ncbi:MAG: hypothetical protein LLG04_08720, partial [Parachlamydia sp.]|nr:hypothetical protein [Parachlamydia sp.]